MSNVPPGNRRGFIHKSVALATAAASTLALGSAAAAPKKKDKASAKQSAPVDGTLLRGADGSLYFLPDNALATFKLSAIQTAALQKRFGANLKKDLVHLEGKGVADAGIHALKIKNVTYVNLAPVRANVKGYKVIQALHFKKQ